MNKRVGNRNELKEKKNQSVFLLSLISGNYLSTPSEME